MTAVAVDAAKTDSNHDIPPPCFTCVKATGRKHLFFFSTYYSSYKQMLAPYGHICERNMILGQVLQHSGSMVIVLK